MQRFLIGFISFLKMPAGRQSAIYAITILILLGNRLTSIVHAESGAIVSAVAFFTVGITSIAARKRGRTVQYVFWQALAGLILPLALLSLTALWIPNCDYPRGLAIFLLLVVPSVVLSVAIANILVVRRVHRERTVFIAVGLVVALIPSLLTLKFFPQFYLYNHVFGGILGPVYEEQLFVRSGMIWYRTLTCCWALLLFMAASYRNQKVYIGLVVACIGLLYLFASDLGLRGSIQKIGAALGNVVVTDHFRIIFDESTVERRNVVSLAAYHEYHFDRLSSALETQPERMVDVYVYPDSETKAKLTGAGTTSVAPVWLPRPQIHILDSELGRSLDHELVHVFTREFGESLTNASFEIGLVEGIAVALEAPDGLPDIDAQVQALFTDSAFTSVYTDDRVNQIISSPFFWLDRGAVSYSVSGSFIRWLLREYPVEKFKRVYTSGDYEAEYGEPVESLIDRWKNFILQTPPDANALRMGTGRFLVPSLFEQRCPHHVPEYLELYRQARRSHLSGEFSSAKSVYSRALEINPEFLYARADLARLLLQSGEIDEAYQLIKDVGEPFLPVMEVQADILLATSRFEAATDTYQDLLDRLPEYAAHQRLRIGLKQRLSTANQPSQSVFTAATGILQINGRPDSIRTVALLARALELTPYNPDEAQQLLEHAISSDESTITGGIFGLVSVLQFWHGDFESAVSSARRASDYFQNDRNDALADYYEYIFNLSTSANDYSTTH
ncbi:MAG: tetratricopeptide repeat protein [Rhodothermales bacterium]|nr:tetratricopeptide repeat protein [Rhodothermales bacterium]